MHLSGFLAELKRRNVYKVAVAYAVVAWLLIQAASILFPTFEAPLWVMKVFVALIVLGFLLALVLAWAFELTPEGIKRSEDVAPNESITRRTGRKLMAGVAVVAVIAAGLLTFQLFRPAGATTTGPKATASAAIPDKSIAVLPFENLSDDKTNAYFADGIQDQILTKLASVAELKVISRTSTVKYKSRPEDLKTVARELGVATVLEGTVQRSGDRVRVNVQLIDARADTHLWAKNYDRELKDVFEVQSEVSQEIADALRAKLSPSEARVLAKAATQDPQAYDSFLKGEYGARQARSLVSAERFAEAEANYRSALERDPGFALAAARLAENRLVRHWYLAPLSAAEFEETRSMIDRALALAPELPDAHVALGAFHYWGSRQYEPALAAFRRALELQPSSADALEFSAAVGRRQGYWDRSLSELAKAAELDPRDPSIPQSIAVTRLILRQWQEAKRASYRALAVDPEFTTAKRVLVEAWVNGDGKIAEARRVVADMPAGARLSNNTVRGAVSGVIDDRTYLRVLERDFAGALQEWEPETADPMQRANRLAARSAIRVLAADAAVSVESEGAREHLETILRDRPGEPTALIQLSWVYLALGREADALRAAAEAARSLPIEKDHLTGPEFTMGEVEIQARAGRPREAITTLRYLLTIPAGRAASIQRLKLDPVWDPIRNDPEFQQLLAGKEQIGPNK
ncbi:MAG: Adenylate cyclase [uncultured Chthoniobacterales bacterium]|uniref:Adenylate cyclase n=1 Tax=uncultured Chthoniobacterales bacterium TaxID=1836801 RepID=A0A6J4ILD3_9BACT|nr:MAG: Adenylate cyclase [uncultured Chthoniobacterales bacterium]